MSVCWSDSAPDFAAPGMTSGRQTFPALALAYVTVEYSIWNMPRVGVRVRASSTGRAQLDLDDAALHRRK